MARILLIAYTTYVHDGRVKRHAEALADRGDHIDVVCLDSGHNGLIDGVNPAGNDGSLGIYFVKESQALP